MRSCVNSAALTERHVNQLQTYRQSLRLQLVVLVNRAMIIRDIVMSSINAERYAVENVIDHCL